MSKPKQHNYFLDANTLVKVIAYHKHSDEQFEQTMTFSNGLNLRSQKIISINVCN